MANGHQPTPFMGPAQAVVKFRSDQAKAGQDNQPLSIQVDARGNSRTGSWLIGRMTVAGE